MSVTSRSNADEVTQWRHLKRIVEKLSEEAWRGIALKEAVRPALYEPSVAGSFNKTTEAHTFNVVRSELLNALILWCYRTWDRKFDDETLSLPNAVRRLEKPEIRRIVERERSNDWREKHYVGDIELEKLMRPRILRDMRTARKNCIDRVDDILNRYHEFSSLFNFEALEIYRHKLVAHSLDITRIEKKKAQSGETVEPLKYGMAEKIVDYTVPIIKDLGVSVQGIDRDFDSGAENQRKYAERFWLSRAKDRE